MIFAARHLPVFVVNNHGQIQLAFMHSIGVEIQTQIVQIKSEVDRVTIGGSFQRWFLVLPQTASKSTCCTSALYRICSDWGIPKTMNGSSGSIVRRVLRGDAERPLPVWLAPLRANPHPAQNIHADTTVRSVHCRRP